VLPDSKADLLLFGNAERAIVTLAHRLAAGEPIDAIRDLRGSAFMVPRNWRPEADWSEIDSSDVDTPAAGASPGSLRDGGRPTVPAEPVADPAEQVLRFMPQGRRRLDRARSVVRLPAYEAVRDDPVLYAHASRTFHVESNPATPARWCRRTRARRVDQSAPIPLTTPKWTASRPALPAQAAPGYGEARIPAFEMIRFSVNIMRGCFGGCTSARSPSTRAASSRAARRNRSCARSRKSATARRASPG